MQRNRYHYLPGVIGVPIIGVLVALGYRHRRARRATSRDSVARGGLTGAIAPT